MKRIKFFALICAMICAVGIFSACVTLPTGNSSGNGDSSTSEEIGSDPAMDDIYH